MQNEILKPWKKNVAFHEVHNSNLTMFILDYIVFWYKCSVRNSDCLYNQPAIIFLKKAIGEQR